MPSLFQHKIDPRCVYCANGRPLNKEQIVCPKKGVMGSDSHCRKFIYDPLRRIPPRPQSTPEFELNAEDFTL